MSQATFSWRLLHTSNIVCKNAPPCDLGPPAATSWRQPCKGASNKLWYAWSQWSVYDHLDQWFSTWGSLTLRGSLEDWKTGKQQKMTKARLGLMP